jgi:hypothetical protein
MKKAARSFNLVHAWIVAMAVVVFGAALNPTAQAADIHWKFSGYTTTPPQSQLDAVKAGPGRIEERKLSGAFQPAKSGAGTVSIYFRNDNVDRQVYLTTLKFSFTTGVDMLALTPGQKLHFKGTLVMGGNALAKALPARGSGTIAADNGDYFLTTEARIDQPGNGEGTLTVPGGVPGSTFVIHVHAQDGAYGALGGNMDIGYVAVGGAAPVTTSQATPAPSGAPAADPLGSRLEVSELDGLWVGLWTRRPGTDIFDAVWRSAQYPEVRDIVRLEKLAGDEVVFTRDGNGGRYFGKFSPDGRAIHGTASWYAAGMSWSARIGQ